LWSSQINILHYTILQHWIRALTFVIKGFVKIIHANIIVLVFSTSCNSYYIIKKKNKIKLKIKKLQVYYNSLLFKILSSKKEQVSSIYYDMLELLYFILFLFYLLDNKKACDYSHMIWYYKSGT